MKRHLETGYEHHPGFEVGSCSLQITIRPSGYGTSGKGFACSHTGGHCLPGEYCSARRANSARTMDDILAYQAKRNVLRPAPRLGKVECGYCGWTGKRKIGDLAYCPKCGSPAGFQPVDGQRGKRG